MISFVGHSMVAAATALSLMSISSMALVTEATSSVMAGADGGEAGASTGTAGGATFGASSELSVVQFS